MAVKKSTKSVASKAATTKAAKPTVTVAASPKTAIKAEKKSTITKQQGVSNTWLQDATLEIPVYPGTKYAPGERELDFSVGMRQQEDDGLVRSELRGRALIHINGAVLALAEAACVNVTQSEAIPADLPQQLYLQLKGHLEQLLALGGHTPPLPRSLDKVA